LKLSAQLVYRIVQRARERERERGSSAFQYWYPVAIDRVRDKDMSIRGIYCLLKELQFHSEEEECEFVRPTMSSCR
jgi:hypothetical protein